MHGYVADLDGLGNDILNTLRLFGKLMYDCFPHYDLANPKLMWTKQGCLR